MRHTSPGDLSQLLGRRLADHARAGLTGSRVRSPCLKLKPKSKGSKPGFQMVNVQPYGGGLWHTWFDRDLSVAGCVLVKEGSEISHRLVGAYSWQEVDRLIQGPLCASTTPVRRRQLSSAGEGCCQARPGASSTQLRL